MREESHFASVESQIFIITFFLLYIIFLVRKVAKDQLDLYDFIMLSFIATIPTGFVFMRGVVVTVAKVINIEFPFLILFSALHLVSFIYLYSLVVRINKLHKKVINSVQESSLAQVEKKS